MISFWDEWLILFGFENPKVVRDISFRAVFIICYAQNKNSQEINSGFQACICNVIETQVASLI